MLGAGATFIVTHLSAITPGETPGARLAYAAGIMGLVVYSTALVATWWLPEPVADVEE
jgi:hypothetical protein